MGLTCCMPGSQPVTFPAPGRRASRFPDRGSDDDDDVLVTVRRRHACVGDYALHGRATQACDWHAVQRVAPLGAECACSGNLGRDAMSRVSETAPCHSNRRTGRRPPAAPPRAEVAARAASGGQRKMSTTTVGASRVRQQRAGRPRVDGAPHGRRGAGSGVFAREISPPLGVLQAKGGARKASPRKKEPCNQTRRLEAAVCSRCVRAALSYVKSE